MTEEVFSNLFFKSKNELGRNW